MIPVTYSYINCYFWNFFWVVSWMITLTFHHISLDGLGFSLEACLVLLVDHRWFGLKSLIGLLDLLGFDLDRSFFRW